MNPHSHKLDGLRRKVTRIDEQIWILFKNGKHSIAYSTSHFHDYLLFFFSKFWKLSKEPMSIFEEVRLVLAVELVPVFVCVFFIVI
jgi:hypothetical protein